MTALEKERHRLYREINKKLESLSNGSLDTYVFSSISELGGMQKRIYEDLDSEVLLIKLEEGEEIPLHFHGEEFRREILVVKSGMIKFGLKNKEEIVSSSKAIEANKLHSAKAITKAEAFVVFIPKLSE